ncbi:kinase-like domain-containing protein [Abortiporus biennis]|nr:kinase-like domain-containing protein [Abortiporus biennis]
MFPLTLAQVKDLIPTATCLTDHFKQLARPITIADLQVPSSLIYRQVYATECNGVPIIIKFGTHVFKVEADVMDFVAKNTSIRVPMVHAFLFDDNSGMGFLVEERLPGRTLEALLSAMDQSTQETIIKDNRRDFLGPLQGRWDNSYFYHLSQHFPINENTGRTFHTFLKYFYDVPGYYQYRRPKPTFEEVLSSFDLSKPPMFSHGDLMPCNILVENGHIVGVIDWAEAGWYPYFWDSYVLLKTVKGREKLQAAAMWKDMIPQLCESYEKEYKTFNSLRVCAEFMY